MPTCWIGVLKGKPILDTCPHAKSEATFEEKVSGAFLSKACIFHNLAILSFVAYPLRTLYFE
jgi:hypothetical protein